MKTLPKKHTNVSKIELRFAYANRSTAIEIFPFIHDDTHADTL